MVVAAPSQLHRALRLSGQKNKWGKGTRIFPKLSGLPGPISRSSGQKARLLLAVVSMTAVQFRDSAHPRIEARRKTPGKALSSHWGKRIDLSSQSTCFYFPEFSVNCILFCILFRVFSCNQWDRVQCASSFGWSWKSSITLAIHIFWLLLP